MPISSEDVGQGLAAALGYFAQRNENKRNMRYQQQLAEYNRMLQLQDRESQRAYARQQADYEHGLRMEELQYGRPDPKDVALKDELDRLNVIADDLSGDIDKLLPKDYSFEETIKARSSLPEYGVLQKINNRRYELAKILNVDQPIPDGMTPQPPNAGSLPSWLNFLQPSGSQNQAVLQDMGGNMPTLEKAPLQYSPNASGEILAKDEWLSVNYPEFNKYNPTAKSKALKAYDDYVDAEQSKILKPLDIKLKQRQLKEPTWLEQQKYLIGDYKFKKGFEEALDINAEERKKQADIEDEKRTLKAEQITKVTDTINNFGKIKEGMSPSSMASYYNWNDAKAILNRLLKDKLISKHEFDVKMSEVNREWNKTKPVMLASTIKALNTEIVDEILAEGEKPTLKEVEKRISKKEAWKSLKQINKNKKMPALNLIPSKGVQTKKSTGGGSSVAPPAR